MEERTQGLILRTRPLTETSLIVHWLTPDLGRLATVAKGALRPKSPFRGKLDLFYLADLSFHRSRRSELHILREVALRGTHPALRQDIVRLQHAAYCAALVELTTEIETPLPKFYELLVSFLHHLANRPAQPSDLFAFEMKLLEELGQTPDLDCTTLSGGARRLLELFTHADWPAIGLVKLSPTQVHELCQFLHRFLNYHLGKVPAGRQSLCE
jgi:DNA repair protein RecO (recombination protein O)